MTTTTSPSTTARTLSMKKTVSLEISSCRSSYRLICKSIVTGIFTVAPLLLLLLLSCAPAVVVPIHGFSVVPTTTQQAATLTTKTIASVRRHLTTSLNDETESFFFDQHLREIDDDSNVDGKNDDSDDVNNSSNNDSYAQIVRKRNEKTKEYLSLCATKNTIFKNHQSKLNSPQTKTTTTTMMRNLILSPQIENLLSTYSEACKKNHDNNGNGNENGSGVYIMNCPPNSGKSTASEFLLLGNHQYRPPSALSFSCSCNCDDSESDIFFNSVSSIEVLDILNNATTLTRATYSSNDNNKAEEADKEPPLSFLLYDPMVTMMGTGGDTSLDCEDDLNSFNADNSNNHMSLQNNQYDPGNHNNQFSSTSYEHFKWHKLPTTTELELLSEQKLPVLIIDNFNNEASKENEVYVQTLVEESKKKNVFVLLITNNTPMADSLLLIDEKDKKTGVQPINSNYDPTKEEWNKLWWKYRSLKKLITPMVSRILEEQKHSDENNMQINYNTQDSKNYIFCTVLPRPNFISRLLLRIRRIIVLPRRLLPVEIPPSMMTPTDAITNVETYYLNTKKRAIIESLEQQQQQHNQKQQIDNVTSQKKDYDKKQKRRRKQRDPYLVTKRQWQERKKQ